MTIEIRGRVQLSECDRQFTELKKALPAELSDYEKALGLLGKLSHAHKIEEEPKVNMANEILELRQSLRSESTGRVSDITRMEEELKTLKLARVSDVARLREELKKLSAGITTLRDEMSAIEAGKEYSKYLTALQDLNSIHGLEKNMSQSLSKEFTKLRQKRTGESYCIIQDDYDELKLYKTVSIRDRLDTMSAACAAKFAKGFGPSFINAVKTLLSTFVATGTVAEVDKQLADEWWTDN